MAEEVGTNIKFQIELVASDDDVYDDIQYVGFVRTPIIKQASFCIIHMNLPVILVKHLQNTLASNIQDIWKMYIYMIDENEDDSYDCIFDKFYQILSIQEQENITYTKDSVMTKLLLVNPILQNLETTTAFNKIITEATAYDAIQNYESFLNQMFGQFHFSHVGVTEQLNTFRYEQIFIPPSINTINVPKYLINTYKPFHSYSFYFFDDFSLSEDSDKEITAHFINLANVYNQFEQFDILEYGDYAKLSKKISTKEFTDPFKLLDKDSFASIIFRTKDVIGGTVKKMKSFLSQLTPTNTASEKILDKDLKTSKSQIEIASQKQSTRASIIYVPDNEKNAKKRLEVAKDLMFNKFERLVIYETDNCLPYWMQFGYLYNMEPDDYEEYKYTPIAIINHFRRTKAQDEDIKMIHTCRYMMLKVIPEKDEYQSTFIERVAI